MTEPQRILAVIESLGRGGAERHLVSLACALRSRGHVVRVAALWPPYDLAVELEEREIAVECLDVNQRWNVAQGVSRLRRAIKRFRPTVVHSQLFLANLYTALATARDGPPTVTTLQCTDYVTYPATSAYLHLRKRVDAWMLRSWMNERIAVSRAVAMHYKSELGLGGRIDIVPNCIDAAHLRLLAGSNSGARARYGVPEGEKLLVYPARLTRQKGHRIMLDAAAALRRDRVRYHLLLIGDGPDRAAIEARVRDLDLSSAVSTLGPLPHDEVIALIASADALVFSSLAEGLPVAVLEAAALGTPIVVTTAGGTAEVIEHEHSGLLVRPNDSQELASAIVRVLQDPRSAHERAQRAVELAERFDAPAIAARHEAIYDRLVGATDRRCRP